MITELNPLIDALHASKHWEINHDDLRKIQRLQDSNGVYGVDDSKEPSTLLGLRIFKSDKKGTRLIYRFSDGSTHIIEFNV